MLARRLAPTAMLFSALVGCASASDTGAGDEPIGTVVEPLTAVCSVTVQGVGAKDVEADYLPHVVMCENGAASFEALKAQAVAARTYLYYSLKGASGGTIADGQNAQVYTCSRAPTEELVKAVAETAGAVLRYEGITIAAFFVAGGKGTPPACVGSSAASTEKYVTYNEGLSGNSIHQTTLGSVNPANKQNRGCMSQNGSDCLAKEGKTYTEILHFYYGADIAVERAEGTCVPEEPVPDAGATEEPTESDASVAADVGDPNVIQVGELPSSEGGCAMAHAGPEERSASCLLGFSVIVLARRKGRRRPHAIV